MGLRTAASITVNCFIVASTSPESPTNAISRWETRAVDCSCWKADFGVWLGSTCRSMVRSGTIQRGAVAFMRHSTTRGGMQELSGDPATWESIPEQAGNLPSRSYSSRISSSLPWILEETEHDGSLAQENYGAWQRLYFSPAQIAASAVSGPLGDFDQDGIVNLLEFALNLDPTFSEQITLAPAVGLRGLPNIRMETISGEERVTVEYVRRTVASGSGLTCFTQFSSDLEDWTAGGTETVEAINPRWERVKVVDSLPVSGSSRRFARVRVVVVE